MVKNNHLANIVREIRNLDKDNNGYLLANELNKVFKQHYITELEGKSLTKIARKYGSIQNRSLVEHKKFIANLNQLIKEQERSDMAGSPVSKRRIDEIKNLIQADKQFQFGNYN